MNAKIESFPWNNNECRSTGTHLKIGNAQVVIVIQLVKSYWAKPVWSQKDIDGFKVFLVKYSKSIKKYSKKLPQFRMKLIQTKLSFGDFLIKYEVNRQLFEEWIAQGVIFYHHWPFWKSPAFVLLAQSWKSRSRAFTGPYPG